MSRKGGAFIMSCCYMITDPPGSSLRVAADYPLFFDIQTFSSNSKSYFPPAAKNGCRARRARKMERPGQVARERHFTAAQRSYTFTFSPLGRCTTFPVGN